MGLVFEVIGVIATVILFILVVSKIIEIHEKWSELYWRVNTTIPREIDENYKSIERLCDDICRMKASINETLSESMMINPDSVKNNEPVLSSSIENDIASLCERVTMLEQYVHFMMSNENISYSIHNGTNNNIHQMESITDEMLVTDKKVNEINVL